MTDKEARQYRFADWLNRAKNDEQSLLILARQDGPPSTICFLAQQMAEKLLKGLLAFLDTDVPKIHDLSKLLVRVRTFLPNAKKLTPQIELLDEYYIEGRYPGDYPDLTSADLEDAVDAAQRIKQFVLEAVTEKGASND